MSASPLADAIAEIRRAAARTALSDIEDAVKAVENQAIRIAKLEEALEEKSSSIDKNMQHLRNDLLALRNYLAVEFATKQIPEEVDAQLSQAEQHGTRLASSLKDVRALVHQIKRLQLDMTAFASGRQKLQSEGRATLSRKSAKPTDQWQTLRDLQLIWNEGLDLMSGLSLRHEGLENGLCRFADQIIAQFHFTNVNAITVPGRGGPGWLTQVVHLRFPEWTIWALPLTAYEFWHLAERASHRPDGSNEMLDAILESADTATREQLQEQAASLWRTEEFQKCLADIFGMFVMGPAYACAAIWLMLDPTDPTSEQRALCILEILGATQEYRPTYGILFEQWRQAAPNLNQFRYQAWIKPVNTYLETVVNGFRFKRWEEKRDKWIRALSENRPEEIIRDSPDIRYVLSAAWKARLEASANADVIAKTCRAVCEEICKLKPDQPAFVGA
jgi:hypothetical protein